jgi:hypothetical protein
MGLLYDQKGNRFTPAHANKKGRRYRYYISEVAIKNPGKKSNEPLRLPALEIEELVMSQATLLLQSSQRMMDVLVTPNARSTEIHRASEAIREWRSATPDKVLSLLKAVLRRVVVETSRVEIQIDKQAIQKAIMEASGEVAVGTDGPDILKIESNAQLKRCGGEVRFVLPPDTPGAKQHTIPSLIKAIARAHDWVGRIISGDIPHQRAIAAKTGWDERYISRLIPLAFLAPDITESILEGKHPEDVSLQACTEKLSIDWSKQRACLNGTSVAPFLRLS